MRVRPFYKSLYFKLAISFAGIILLVGAIQLAIILPTYRDFLDELDQRTYWELAGDIAERVQPQLQAPVDYDALRKELFKVQLYLPRIEIYVLDDSGRILTYVSPDDEGPVKEAIDLSKLIAFTKDQDPTFPVYGPNPRHRLRPEKIYSLAPITLGDRPGYLYVLLESVKYEILIGSSGEFFILKSFALGLGVLAIVATLLSLLFFRFGTRYFRSLTRIVEQFAGGNFSERAPIHSDDEIADVAAAVNDMADQLVRSMRERRELVASISHDLRSPLTSIAGFVEMLRDQDSPVDAGRREEYLQIIHNNVQAQRHLVNDLFEFSKLEANDRMAEKEPLALDDLVDGVCVRHEPAAREKQIALNVLLPDQTPRVLADAVLLERVLTNLITNAIRYTEPGGKIEVTVKHVGERVTVSVSDTGIGIGADDLPRIFDSFYRANKHRSKEHGSSGLGLAIVKRILDMHGTAIQVQSVLGQGSSFSFSLPIVQQ